MKKITLFVVMMLAALNMSAQANIISTSFYSQALDETKMVNVFLPPGYEANPDLHYPVIYYLHGWQGSQNEGNGVMNTAYTMINQGLIDPVIIVCAHNSPPPFGGSVYTNSILWGDYETYMVEDLCNWVESTYRAMPGKQYRAVFGMSMGGYGAFRYGILHNDKYCALAACAAPISFLEDYMCMQFRQMILQANQGPPYFYNYATGGMYTQIYFLYYGAFAPNYNTPQTYINPAILEFPLDENGNYIDTILAKVIPHDIASLINQLTPESSPGIYFGCGTNDPFFLYPGNLDVKDSLDLYGIPFTFYSHGGGHTMPAEFTENAFMFFDSLLMSPVIPCSCLPQGITFTSQAQIDNFQTNYPGCIEIEGSVQIWGSGITSLNGLNVLISIEGNFAIYGNDILTSLTGLEGLNYIGGNLDIIHNQSLTSLSGLDNLTSIGGTLFIDNNAELISLIGLENLASILGDLVIGEYIFGDAGNPSLLNCNGLQSLITVGGSISVSGNMAMTDLVGLGNLNSIMGGLSISENWSLSSLTGLENLASIGGDLKIGEYLGGNSLLASITGLGSLISIGGDLQIIGNTSLSTCDAEWLCNYLAATAGAVNIYNNGPGCSSIIDVANICGDVPCLPYGNYYFTSQSDIDNFQTAFPNCADLQGNVSISGISDLTGLDDVISIGGNLTIESCQSLATLTGLENLTSIGCDLKLYNHAALISLAALNNLTSIGGYLWIEYSSLSSLVGLDRIAASSITTLIIRYNSSLSTCEVQSICDYLAAPNGTVYINNNAPGCNSQAQVIAACEIVGIEETALESALSVYPNPLSEMINITLAIDKPGPASILMTNQLGQIVAFITDNQYSAGIHQIFWNASNLPTGIYFLRLHIGDEVVTRKVVKY